MIREVDNDFKKEDQMLEAEVSRRKNNGWLWLQGCQK